MAPGVYALSWEISAFPVGSIGDRFVQFCYARLNSLGRRRIYLRPRDHAKTEEEDDEEHIAPVHDSGLLSWHFLVPIFSGSSSTCSTDSISSNDENKEWTQYMVKLDDGDRSNARPMSYHYCWSEGRAYSG